jgi:hypothetical protein
MVRFRVYLNLNNIKKLQSITDSKAKQKAKKILKFYKLLAKLIVYEHNNDIKLTQQTYNEYSEPLINIKKNIFVVSEIPDNPAGHVLQSLIEKMYPPTIEIDFQFKISKRREHIALTQFKKDFGTSLTKHSNKELRTLYYSTKIINFVNKLKNYFNSGIYWKIFQSKTQIKTHYKPNISLSDATVLSLH